MEAEQETNKFRLQ